LTRRAPVTLILVHSACAYSPANLRAPASLAATAFSLGPAFAESASARNDFLKLIDRPRIPLSPRVSTLPDAAGRLRYSFSFTSDSNQRVPGLILRKESLIGHRFPVVIALHGTGGNKEGQIPLLEQLASKGFLAVAIDGTLPR
jgi:predicted dienelactone hydrolase